MRSTLRTRVLTSVCFSAILLTTMPRPLPAEISISIRVGPPALPVYIQPPCPVEGYLWTPGYWALGAAGYYWIPGVWVAPPTIGVLWTPGYWAFESGAYRWSAGYWGPHVGFYGGVNYGFGFTGVGFVGGGWSGRTFRYNTAVTNVNTMVVRNVYVDRTVIKNVTINNYNRPSFNGPGGITARPTAQEQSFQRERHIQATSVQMAHGETARQDRTLLASVNQGHPAVAAMDTVNGRKFNQQGRIANGVGSGQLTAGETKRLETREANVNHEVRADRQANGGALTPQERRQVHQQQNNLNRSIYDDKHNAANAAYGNNKVDARRNEQQQRIAQGVRSGQMTPAETAKAERTEQQVNRQVRTERRANGGALTPEERHAANHEQNHASREIHEEKHNAVGEHR